MSIPLGKQLQPWPQWLEKFISCAFCPSPPLGNVDKTLLSNTSFHLSFSNIERGNGGVGTYSLGITVMSLCFWHFPTQFVHGCRCSFHFKTCHQRYLSHQKVRKASTVQWDWDRPPEWTDAIFWCLWVFRSKWLNNFSTRQKHQLWQNKINGERSSSDRLKEGQEKRIRLTNQR